MDLVKEIAVKTDALPFELQREVLDFVEFIAHKNQTTNVEKQKSFKSVRGILKHLNLENLEQDITETRREMWQNFPREEPK